MSEVQRKWDLRYQQHRDGLPAAAEVLTQNQHLLPAKGSALDLACGLGANALFLAKLGLMVTAQDISPVAIKHLRQWAQQQYLQVNAEVRDVMREPPLISQYDVLLVSNYLERSLVPALISSLKPSGLLFYQTWCRHKTTTYGPKNPEYLLEDNELLSLFSGLKIRVYREEAMLGDVSHGWRDMAMLVAERVM